MSGLFFHCLSGVRRVLFWSCDMRFFEINRNKHRYSWKLCKYGFYFPPVFSIFYVVFIFCKINFLTISYIGSRSELVLMHEYDLTTSGSCDILFSIRLKEGDSIFYEFKKMTSLHLDSETQYQCRECQCDDAHTSEWSWSDDTPYLLWFFWIHHLEEDLRKCIKIVSYREVYFS